MATRIYLPSSGAIPSGVTAPTVGTWTETTGFDRLGASTSRGVTAMTNKTQARTAAAVNNTWLDRMYVVGPLAGQTFGASTVKGTIRALESAANDNVDAMRLLIRVVAPDGTTFRGTIYGPTNSTVAEFNTTLRAKRMATGGATTSVVVTEGDYLVIEIGATATTGGVSISTSINYGNDSATDLGDNETDTTALNPFVEFAANMKFLGQSYGQAQARIKATTTVSGQAHATLKYYDTTASNGGTGVTSVVIGATSFTAGSLLIVYWESTTQVSSVSDDRGTVYYVYPSTQFLPNSNSIGIAYATINTTQTYTITINLPSGNIQAAVSSFYAGTGLVWAPYDYVSTLGTSNTPTAPAALYLAPNENLLFGLAAYSTAVTQTGPSTPIANITTVSTGTLRISSHRALITSNTADTTTLSGSDGWAEIGATFFKATRSNQVAQAQAFIAPKRVSGQAQADIKQTYPFNAYAKTVKADVPDHWYRLGESSGTTAVDEMGSINGVYNNAITLGIVGALTGDTDTAVTFDTQFETVSVTGYTLPTTAISLEAWFKGTSFGSSAGLIGRSNGSTQGAVIMLNTASDIEFRINANVLGHAASGYNDGNWHHVVGTWSSSAIFNLYFDGELITGPFSVAGPIVTPTAEFLVGNVANASHAAFNGTIDEPAVYSRVLTDVEVREHYNARVITSPVGPTFGQAQASMVKYAKQNVSGQANAVISRTYTSITDTFTRNVSDDLGTADTGGAYTYISGTATGVDVNGTEATFVQEVASQYIASMNDVLLNTQSGTSIKFRFKLSGTPSGATNFLTFNLGLGTADNVIGIGYVLTIVYTTVGSALKIAIGANGGALSPTNGTTFVANTWFVGEVTFARTSESSIRIREKIYQEGSTPTAYQFRTVATTVLPGHLGLIFANSSDGLTASFDNLVVENASWTESGQAQASIKNTYFGSGQANTFIRPRVGIGQTSALITTTPVNNSVIDTYTRSVSNALGSADTGGAYTLVSGTANDADVNGTEATFQTSASPYLTNLNSVLLNREKGISIKFDIKVSILPTIGLTFLNIVTGLGSLSTDVTSGYGLSLSYLTATTALRYNAIINNVATGSSSNTTIIANTWYTVETTLVYSSNGKVRGRGKIYLTGSTPSAYGSEVLITSTTTLPGHVALNINANLDNTPLITFDNLEIKDAGWTESGQAQATILVSAASRAYAQAQADIKAIGRGFGQGNADIKATSFALGQTQADIKTTYFALGQSQADIKATGNGFGQANADIKAVNFGSGQAQIDIKATSFGLGQSQADIKQTYYGLGQSQADIKAVGYGLGQCQADIKATNRGFGQAQACIRGNAFGQAQADIKQTYFGLAQAQADIKAVGYGLGQSNADIKAVGRGLGQAQGDIKAQGYGLGQAQGDIKNTYFGLGQAQACIRGNAFGQAQADIKTTYYGLGQAQADIKATSFGLGQAQADIKAIGYGWGQCQADIKQTYFGLGQANAWIKQTYYGLGQAQACIRGNAFGQAQADIKTTYYGLGQGQADIKNTYYGSGQANASIVQTGFGSGQSQADIKQTYTQCAQAQADIKNTYFGLGQSVAWIKNTYYGLGQANAYIILIGQNGYGQSQADIKTTYYGLGQSQAKINAFGVNGYGQCQAYILSGKTGCGQAQADIKAVGYGSGQTQADIKATETSSGQTQAHIRNTYYGSGQSNGWIKQTYYGLGQAQCQIKATDNSSGQAQSDIKQTYTNSGQSQADIKNTYFGSGQANCLIGTRNYGFGQAQGDIKSTTSQSGQAQADVKNTYNGYGQSQADIKTTYSQSAQVNAYIILLQRGYAQAQAQIKNTYVQSGQSAGQIKNTYSVSGNAQGTIKQTVNTYGQTQAQITSSSYANGQAQAAITSGTAGYGQTQAWIKTTATASGQAQGFISKAAGYGQAQGFIRQDRIIKNLTLSDRHSITLTLSDRIEVTTTLIDAQPFIVVESDERNINLSLSDSQGIHLTLSDRSY